MLCRSKAWITQRFAEALDTLSEILLQAGLLSENRPDRRQRQIKSRSIPTHLAPPKKNPASFKPVALHRSFEQASGQEVAGCEPLLA